MPSEESRAPAAPASTLSPRIRALPALLVNQIAAGEVVDRPASVVRELIDNAIDAGAERITLELEQGGVELIRVTDNGRGIDAEDLPLAVAPHAPSKIAAPEDLTRIATMGFRGEALASIASVSRLSIRSRARNADAASIIEIEGDRITPVRPDAGPVGTVVSVRNLFFNTPAR
ncbi:MAG: DNA mismatch repair endonuclease MutL, partial [Planctomycetota bacterium]|nr:DNA mismatch repair endonuclease MutL [Planctomycetota bacterium]